MSSKIPDSSAAPPGALPQPARPVVTPDDLDWCWRTAAWRWSYHPGGGGLWNAVQINVRRRAARFYATRFLEQHGELPVGWHEVNVSYGLDGGVEVRVEHISGQLSQPMFFRPLSDRAWLDLSKEPGAGWPSTSGYSGLAPVPW